MTTDKETRERRDAFAAAHRGVLFSAATVFDIAESWPSTSKAFSSGDVSLAEWAETVRASPEALLAVLHRLISARGRGVDDSGSDVETLGAFLVHTVLGVGENATETMVKHAADLVARIVHLVRQGKTRGESSSRAITQKELVAVVETLGELYTACVQTARLLGLDADERSAAAAATLDAHGPPASQRAVATFSPGEAEQMRSFFAAIADGDDAVTRSEFEAAMRDVLGSDEVVDRFFAAIDADASGELSFDEIVAALPPLVRGDDVDKLMFIFRLYDTSGDGSLEAGEVHVLLAELLNAAREHRAATLEQESLALSNVVAVQGDTPGDSDTEAGAESQLLSKLLLSLLDKDDSASVDTDEFVLPTLRTLCVLRAHETSIRAFFDQVGISVPPFAVETRAKNALAAAPAMWTAWLLGVFVHGIIFYMPYSFPAVYGPEIMQVMDVSLSQLVLLFIVPQLTSVPGNWVGGMLVDWYGMKSLSLVIGLVVTAAAALTWLAIGIKSFALLVVARGIYGLTEAAYVVQSMAALRFALPRQVDLVLAVTQTFRMTPNFLERLILPNIDFETGFGPLYLGFGLILVFIALMHIGLDGRLMRATGRVAKDGKAHSIKDIVANMTPGGVPGATGGKAGMRHLPPIIIANVFLAIAYFSAMYLIGGFIVFIILDREGGTLASANAVAAIGPSIVMVGVTLFGSLTAKIGLRVHTIFFGCAAAAAMCALTGFVQDVPLIAFLIVYYLLALPIATNVTTITALYVPQPVLGLAGGLLMAIGSLGLAAAFLLAGYLYEQPIGNADAPLMIFLLLAVVLGLAVIAALAMMVFDRRKNGGRMAAKTTVVRSVPPFLASIEA